eukprot:gene16999-23276_t
MPPSSPPRRFRQAPCPAANCGRAAGPLAARAASCSVSPALPAAAVAAAARAEPSMLQLLQEPSVHATSMCSRDFPNSALSAAAAVAGVHGT